MQSSQLEYELKITLEKIGRNVVHFQKLEQMLKFLISRSFLQGSAGDLKDNFRKNVSKASQKTMGNLVKEYIERIYLGEQKIDETKFSVQFQVKANDEYINERKTALNDIVAQRNKLIHQMLASFNQTSIESCRKLSVALDEQEQIIKSEFLLIQAQTAALVDAYKQI